jgi:hypothetical protein
VRHEEPRNAAAARDAEGRHLRRQRRLLVVPLQALQRGDHLLAAGKLGAAGIGAEFALAAEPHHDHARQNTQNTSCATTLQ